MIVEHGIDNLLVVSDKDIEDFDVLPGELVKHAWDHSSFGIVISSHETNKSAYGTLISVLWSAIPEHINYTLD